MIILPSLFAIAAVLLVFLMTRTFISVLTQYQKGYSERAKVYAADMFLLISPGQLFQLNIIFAISIGIFIWLVIGAWVLTIVGTVLSFFSYPIFLKVLKKRRKIKIVAQLPDLLLSVSRSMKAGSNLNQSIVVAVNETSGPLADEFSLFLKQIQIGVSFEEALEDMDKRIQTEEISLFVSSMLISREVGGNLADTLDRLSDSIRRKIEMVGKIDALTSQGRMQGVVMSLLPMLVAAVLYQIEPTYMRMLFTVPQGWLTITIVIVLELTGYFFIRKIVNIDV